MLRNEISNGTIPPPPPCKPLLTPERLLGFFQKHQACKSPHHGPS